MSVSPDTIAQRVARGAEWLDAHEGGWVHIIKLEDLDMGSGCRCIGGQLYNSFRDFIGAYRMQSGESERLGFDAMSLRGREIEPEYRSLTAEWKRVIRARRGEE